MEIGKTREMLFKLTTAGAAVGALALAGCGGHRKIDHGPYKEIVQFATGSKTFADYRNYSGEGPLLHQYETVDVDCLITDKAEANDSTRGLWYHLVGPPAVRGLFTPSNNFENGVNDPNSGPAADPNVPDCLFRLG